MFSVTIFRPLTFARNYATIADPKKQIREVYFNRITAPKKSRAKNNTNSAKEFVLFPYGAEKRIRTSGRVTPVTRFPIVLLKPLRHLCTEQKLFYNNFAKNATSFYTLSPFFRLRNEKIFLPIYSPVPFHNSITSFSSACSL